MPKHTFPVQKLLPCANETKIMTSNGVVGNLFISQIPMIPYDLHFQFQPPPFPVQFSFLVSKNKMQRQSLKVGLNLEIQCFSQGQL